jgi:hypothetical protein
MISQDAVFSKQFVSRFDPKEHRVLQPNPGSRKPDEITLYVLEADPNTQAAAQVRLEEKSRPRCDGNH